MFGMLDYRAHKLLQLLWLPFAILAKLSSFVIIPAVAIIIAESTSYSTLVKIIIAYILLELIGIIAFQVIGALGIWISALSSGLLTWFRRMALTTRKHKPSRSTGSVLRWKKKFAHDIANWTPEDTYELLSLMNWRARLFFGGKIRIRVQRTATELKRIFQESGKQPTEIGINGIEEIRKQVPGGNVSWFEHVIVTQYLFNSIVGITLIVFVICSTAILKNQ
jgi:hypothetical protein